MINLNQLRAFYEVAKHLSFSRAARELFVTQPAVTAQVKLFEKSCQFNLFKRRSGQLALTEEGLTVFNYAQKIFEYKDDLKNAIDEIKKLKQGTLRIGTARTYARYFMPFLISYFHKCYPDIKVRLDEGSSSEIIQKILDLENELAIIAQVGHYCEVEFTPLCHEELVLIVPPEHHLAAKKEVTPQLLSREPIIMRETGSGTRKLVEEFFIRNNCLPRVLMETSDVEMIKLLVQFGEGISFIVKNAVSEELKQNKLVTLPVIDNQIFLDISVAHLKDQDLSPAANAFLKTSQGLRSQINEIPDKKAPTISTLIEQGT